MTNQALNKIDKNNSRDYWAMHIQQWKQSNLKQQDYCIKAGISYGAFGYWKGVLAAQSSQSDPRTFAPVKVIKREEKIINLSHDIKIQLVTT